MRSRSRTAGSPSGAELEAHADRLDILDATGKWRRMMIARGLAALA
ncbi:MAG: hypothetical protein H0W65_04170 [Sphingomonas sp.]|nr:hypothetical protein [Sphingomonas sp.]MBA3666902.1 hypothetical protein [Sphingomonas sp.]